MMDMKTKQQQFSIQKLKVYRLYGIAQSAIFFIEHLKMCKTMTCQNCNTVFCFSCLQEIDEEGKLLCGGYNKNCKVAPVQNVFLNSAIIKRALKKHVTFFQ